MLIAEAPRQLVQDLDRAQPRHEFGVGFLLVVMAVFLHSPYCCCGRASKQFVAEPRRDDMERPRCYAEILAP